MPDERLPIGFWSLIDAACTDLLDDTDSQQLQAILRQSEVARRTYLEYCRLHSELRFAMGTQRATQASLSHVGAAPLDIDRPPSPPTSPVLGFLGDVGKQGWGLVSSPTIFFSLVALLVLGTAVALWRAEAGRRPGAGVSQIAANPPIPQGERQGKDTNSPRPGHHVPTVVGEGVNVTVAQLVRTAGCRWADQDSEHGDRLSIGRSLHLASGVAEIQFDVGVKVVLQGPAAFRVESAKSARLDRGKLTAAVTREAAHGFRIDTPEAVYVDQGTEFGVEVSPGGSSRACVFKGRVDVAAHGQETAAKQLTADQGVRVEDDGQDMTFIEDRGESFIRSVDSAERDQHVIAYRRFEDRPVGTVLPHTGRNKNPVRATSDSSFSGNDLFVWSPNSRPVFSAEVPVAMVPQSGAANKGCLDLTDPLHANKTAPEVYTNSRFSHASPHDIQQITPESWTVEASVKIKQLQNSRRQTIVCRDGVAGKSARFGLLVNPNDGFAVSFTDVKDRYFSAGTVPSFVKEDQWYHLAATSDGRVLRLYVDSGDKRGYRLAAWTSLPNSGTALGTCGDDCSWAVGRSRLKIGSVGDALFGWIDEVRICDVALDPSEFLFAEKAAGE